MRRICKIDINQPEIVEFLREQGATVQILSMVGSGCPDILVGYRGWNILMEIKNGKGKLTPDQMSWHGCFEGSVHVVRDTTEALAVLTFYSHRPAPGTYSPCG